ncbi:spore cortex biosynthesis protein YabQ [Clostridium perfringens]|uniref:spore cortex biosynthesis protein YabQ n=1 Tax=Clostridium perfringens TaxID=1502 RepID=UPI0024BCD46D|nr:spore cortex biosynthesis protein YabQ [Clostridium perfringens]
MLLDINIQFKIVIFAILSGIIIGFLFDIYREFRGVCKNKILITIEDILFWILCSLIVFVFLLKYNYALIGVYVYVFMGITLVIYLKTLSKYFRRIQHKILAILLKNLRIIFKNIRYAFKNTFTN